MKSELAVLFIVLLTSLHYPVAGLSLTRYNIGVMEVLLNDDGLRIRPSLHSSKGVFATEATKQVLLRMVAEGRSITECAKALGRNASTIREWARDKNFMEELRKLNSLVWQQLDEELTRKAATTMQRIQQVSDEALDRVLFLMEYADSQVVQMRCAQDLLDRNPDTSKTHKVEKTTKNLTLSAEFLHLVETSEREAGTTIDG
jgi:hypothetical protein